MQRALKKCSLGVTKAQATVRRDGDGAHLPGVEEEDKIGQGHRELKPAPIWQGISHASKEELPEGVAVTI